MHGFYACAVGVLCTSVWLTGGVARGQFEQPAGSLPFDDTGTIEQVESDVLRIRDSKGEIWLMQITSDTQVDVEGLATADYLRAGEVVQLTGVVDKKGTMRAPVAEINVFSVQGKTAMGLFAPGDTDPNAKPIRNAGAGEFFIRGKLTAYRNGQFTISAGSQKIVGVLAEDVAISVTLDDQSLAQPGDSAQLKAWYYEAAKPFAQMNRPGRAVVEEIWITLAKPLSSDKKPRPAPAKTSTKKTR